jgi:hypothetical protein
MFVQTKEYILPDPSFTTHSGHTLFCEKCFVVWEAIATKSEPVDILLLTTKYLHALQDFAVKLSFCLCNFQWRVRHMSMKQQPLLIGWSVTVKVWYINMQNIAKPQLPWPSMAKVARTTSHRHRDLDFAIVATQHEHRRRETTYQTIGNSKNFWLWQSGK